MLRSNKTFLTIHIFLQCLFVMPIFALEKESLISFLQEYNASQNKCNGKVAYAIENGFADIAEFLILKGEEVLYYQTSYSRPSENSDNKKIFVQHKKHPLITAVKKGYSQLAVLLIQMGHWKVEEYKYEYHETVPSYDGYEIERKNVMRVAIEFDNYEVVLSLLKFGFDPNNCTALNPSEPTFVKNLPQDRSIYSTPLLQAIESKNLKIADLLLQNGAVIEKVSRSYSSWNRYGHPTNFSGTPLLKAVNDNFIEGVTFLLNYGANPIIGNFSALDLAIEKGYWDIVDILYSAAVKNNVQ